MSVVVAVCLITVWYDTGSMEFSIDVGVNFSNARITVIARRLTDKEGSRLYVNESFSYGQFVRSLRFAEKNIV